MRTAETVSRLTAFLLAGVFGIFGIETAIALSDAMLIPAGTNTYTGAVTGYQEIGTNEPDSTFASLAFDGATPYLATIDENGSLTVRQFDGISWRNVGDPGFATNVFRVSIIFCWGSSPMIAYTDITTGAINAMMFDGTSWNQFGSSPGYHRPNDNPHLGGPSLVCNQMTGNPTIAYIDYVNGANAPAVKEIWGDWDTPIYNSGWGDFSSVSFSPGGDYTLHSLSMGADFYLAYTEAGTGKPILLSLDGGWNRSEVSGMFSGAGNSIAIIPAGVAYANEDSLGFANGGMLEGYAGGSGPYRHVSVASDSNNVPYLLYATSTTSYVMSYDGWSWGQIGAVPFSLDANRIDSAAIVFDNSNTPYVTYIDAAHKAVVRKFDGTNWVVVNALLGTPAIPAGVAYAWDIVGHQELSASEPTSTFATFVYPYLATVGGGGSLTVREFDGSSWTTVGGSGIATNVFRVSLTLYGGMPIVAYTDDTTGAITVLGFNGTSWDQLGSNPPGNHLPDGNPHLGTPSITVDQSAGYLYLAYVDSSEGPNTVSTWRLDLAGWSDSTWFTFTGNAMIPPPGGDYSPNIFWGGALYLSYIDATGKPVAAYYDGSSDWMPASNGGLVESGNTLSMAIIDSKINISYASGSNVGVAETDWWDWIMKGYGMGASGSYVRSSLSHDASDIPYLLYIANTASGSQAYVAKYDGAWSQVGSVPLSLDPAQTDSASLSFDYNTNALYATYIDAAHKAVVRKFNGTDWVVMDNGFNTSYGLALNSGMANGVSMALNSNNTPYVAYIDPANDNKATVMNFVGGTWSTVGTAGFSAANISYLSLAFDSSSVPYVAYTDSANSNEIAVKKFNGSNWVTVGSAGFAYAPRISIAFDSNDLLYAVYLDNDNQVGVKKFNGSNWVTVGSAGPSQNSAGVPSIAFDSNNTPYVAYIDNDYDGKVTVRKLEEADWVAIGGEAFTTQSVDVGYGSYDWFIAIVFDSNDTPYIWCTVHGGQVVIMKFDGSFFYWGTVGADFSDITTDNGFSLVLGPDNTPYVAYANRAAGGAATVKKFDGTDWAVVGSAGFSAGAANYVSATFDSAGFLSVAYQDAGLDYQAAVKKINFPPPPPPSSPGTVSVSTPGTITFSATVVSGTVQAINTTGWSFSVEDTKGASAGYYTTLSVSDLSDGAGHTIAKSNISANVSGGTVSTLSGTTNASVTVPTGAGTIWSGYVPLGSGVTLMQRTGWGGVTGTYGVSLALRANIPAYTPSGTYSGTITLTLVEN